MRKGLGRGLGQGYKNLVPMDSYVHALNAKGVKKVDLRKYAGRWYAQGSIPTWFAEGCSRQTAEYSLRNDGKVQVLNTCVTEDGGKKTIKGTARSISEDNKRLKVSFFPFVEGDYVIEYLDEDYQTALVGHPDKEYLWILTRDKSISDEEYQELLGLASSKGYPPSMIKDER